MKRAAYLFLTLILYSCFGVSSEITLKKDGSGTIAIEYRISEDMLKLGSLDGNEAFPAIPVGEEDFKRTVSRIEGLTLKKFSSKIVDSDYMYNVTLDFRNIQALISFLDTQGQHCSLAEKDGKRILTVVFVPGTDEYTPEMLELMPVIFEGYNFSFKITMPENCETVFFNRAASRISKPPIGAAVTGLNNVSFSAPMGDIFSSTETTAMEIRW